MSSESSDSVAQSVTKEDLDSRHRKEQRDLQARVTQKKKQASKKTRKGVNDECDQLERELKERQLRERNGLDDGSNKAEYPNEAEDLQDQDDFRDETKALALDGTITSKTTGVNGSESPGQPIKGKKPNRAKARLARRAAEQDAAAEEASKEASSMTDYKAREQEVITAAIAAKGLVEHRVRSDGHCLYAAMADQLKQADVSLSQSAETQGLEDFKLVRQEVASWVLKHPDDYLPFLDEDDMAKGIDGYASKIKNTAEWGGQLEIAACARRWSLVVNVLQGDGRIERIEGGEQPGKECWLAYYKHSFGLGEHYNSLRKAT